MAKERTSVRMQAQIQRMAEQGYSARAIARALKVSRKTVRKILGITPKEESEVAGWIQTVDWDYVWEEVYGKGNTIKQIHREVASEVPYLNFWRAFRDKVPRQASPSEITIRLHHKPGEKTQIDFCDGSATTDPKTGKRTSTQFFCGVLPFSSYTFGEFVLTE